MDIIYPGTFDPFSLGHLDLVVRASEMFGKVTVAISENAHKKPMFTLKQRVDMVKLAIKGIKNAEVVGFDTLLVELMRKKNIKCVLRGIRGMVDFEFEFQMSQVNREMLEGYEPIFLMPSEKYMALNSTIIRDIIRHSGDVSRYLHRNVYKYINNLYKR